MSKFVLIKQEVLNILKNSPLAFDPIHAELVLKWVLELKPMASESLRIAAISHDIDRAVTGITEKDLKDYSNIDEFKKEHALRSSNIIGEILTKYHYSESLISNVQWLVENHEFGGDEESDILKDADSLAYFEYNIPFYLKRNGEERTKAKIQFMYKRLSDKAKELVNKMKFSDENIQTLVKESLHC